MLTGRKLLLADDSAAVRKVIELTFADEGMEVITVGDGRSALERVQQVVPDLVLADVYMPEIDGYELCRSIKQDERFAKTPVVLLISSFEPFDEGEARRVGADDVVTKPFQSIRQLVSRVGSLLQRGQDQPEIAHDYSTLGVGQVEPVVAHFEQTASEPPASEPPVTVLVEAPMMDHVEPAQPAGATCSPDIELQTADTMQLERVSDEAVPETGADELSMQDTLEVEPVPVEATEVYQAEVIEVMPEQVSYSETSEPAMAAPARKFDDAVLELEDDEVGPPQMVSDEVFLDLDFEESAAPKVAEAPVYEASFEPAVTDQTAFAEPEIEEPSAVVMEPAWATPPPLTEPGPSEMQPVVMDDTVAESEIKVPETPVAVIEPAWAPAPPLTEPAPENQPEVSSSPNLDGLSAAAIDAIARRMVEQMSDKVVREIAWEVVPELSELLIKQKLEEKK